MEAPLSNLVKEFESTVPLRKVVASLIWTINVWSLEITVTVATLNAECYFSVLEREVTEGHSSRKVWVSASRIYHFRRSFQASYCQPDMLHFMSLRLEGYGAHPRIVSKSVPVISIPLGPLGGTRLASDLHATPKWSKLSISVWRHLISISSKSSFNLLVEVATNVWTLMLI
jgi:hypothetical protein